MSNTVNTTTNREYNFSRKTMISNGEKFYSYLVQDFTGTRYLVPIDHPIEEIININNCNLLTYKKALDKFMSKAFEKELEKDIHLNSKLSENDKTINLSILGEEKSYATNFKIQLLSKNGTINVLKDDSIEKLRVMEDFTKILNNENNKSAFEKLMKSIHKSEDDNPLTAWWEEQDEMKISKDTWGSL